MQENKDSDSTSRSNIPASSCDHWSPSIWYNICRVWVIWVEASSRLISDEAFSLAGNIAFRTILSIFPFLIFLTSLAGFIGTPELAQALVNFLLDVAEHEIVKGIEGEIRSLLTVSRSDLLSLSILITIWTASAGADSLRVALNRAYDLEEHRSFLFLIMQNVLFVLIWSAALLLFAVLIILAPLGMAFVESRIPEAASLSGWFGYIRYPVAAGVLLLALLSAHLFMPAQFNKKDLMPGIFLTIIVWFGLAEIYAYFITHFATYASTYSGLAGVIIAIYFIYLSALVFIFGGEVNRAIRVHRHRLDLKQQQQAS